MKDIVGRCLISFFVVSGSAFLVSISIFNELLRVISVFGVSTITFFIVVWFVGFNKLERENNEAYLKKSITKLKVMMVLRK
jgi:c-di-AMP phosphodiesterase-like protein